MKAKPDYRQFIQIFHSSGSRITEMMKVQAKDVHVDQYCFYRWVLKKKSRKITQVKTTISASVVHLWREQLVLCTSPDDYLFTRGFRPGPKRMDVRPVNIYWSNLVQEPLGVTQGAIHFETYVPHCIEKEVWFGNCCIPCGSQFNGDGGFGLWP